MATATIFEVMHVVKLWGETYVVAAYTDMPYGREYKIVRQSIIVNMLGHFLKPMKRKLAALIDKMGGEQKILEMY